ncbi:MAG: hypothetical protein H5T83_13010 [Actinotalea sp.]|nr:hypothetical protein [Actinotalea sp.]
MERVVERHQVGIHEVTVIETVEDDGCWYHLVVDGVPREGVLAVPPTVDELRDAVVPRRAG